MEFMKLLFIIGALISTLAVAGTPPPVIPLNQYLTVVEYARNGEQTGCGLRATGETADNLWIDVLLNVLTGESGNLFGMFKVVVRKINMRNGVPLLQDGRITYSSIGNIHSAWIKSGSGKQSIIRKGNESPHNDGYMASLDFDNAMDLLIAMPLTNFRVGYKIGENDKPDEVLEFNKRITRGEAGKLSACMKNLRKTNTSRSDKIF